MSVSFVLRLFGALRLESGAECYTKFPTKRSALILARLAISRENRVGRDELAEMLWPDDFQDLTRLRLRQELRRLRQSIGGLDGHLFSDRQWVEIESGFLMTDLQMFDEAIAASQLTEDTKERANKLQAAVELLSGPFLTGYQEPWVVAIRREYEDKARRAWLSLADVLQGIGEVEESLRATMNAVRHAPLDLEANTSLIKRYADYGLHPQARQAFFEFDAMMFRELGRHAPSSLRALMAGTTQEAILEEIPTEVTARPAVARPLPLYGRSELLESIQSSIARPGASVVLVGAVGVGKTHLVKEAAWQFSKANDFPIQFGGTPLPVEDGLFIPDPKTYRSDALDAVRSATECGWRVLGESRMRLQADNITEILVNPLSVPGIADEPPEIRACPSVQILLSKLLEQSNSTPSEADLRDLAQLARYSDGLPSALKVFASRLMIHTADQVLRDLDEALSEYSQELLPDDQTVGLAVMLMAAGLPDSAREVFVALALLDGASVDLAGSLAAPHSPTEIWRALEQQCLITVHDDGPRRRYRVPNPIAYAIRNMTNTEDRADIEFRTWRAVVDWAFEKSRMMVGPNQEYAFNAVQAELPNLVRGLDWAISNDHAIAGRLAVSTWRTVCARGNPSEQADLLLRAAEVGAECIDSELAGEVWLGAATALTITGHLDVAERAFLESLRINHDSGNINGHAWVSINYAASVVIHRDLQRAAEISKEAADKTTKRDLRCIGLCFYAMGLADMGQTAEAIRVGEEVFALRQQTTDLTEQARSYGDLARLYRKVGRPEAAVPLLREGVRRLRETGIQDMLLDTLLILAEMNQSQGDNREVLGEASALANRMGSPPMQLEVARMQMAWASQQDDHTTMIAAIEDVFRLTQFSPSKEELQRSLKALAEELDRHGKADYANAVYFALGGIPAGPMHPGWKALLSSDSHATVCVLAVVMAKEALSQN